MLRGLQHYRSPERNAGTLHFFTQGDWTSGFWSEALTQNKGRIKLNVVELSPEWHRSGWKLPALSMIIYRSKPK